MVKKVLYILVAALFLSATCRADTPNTTPPAQAAGGEISFSLSPKIVGVFLEASVTYVNNEKVRKLVPEKAAKLFPSTKFNLLPFDTTAMALRTYKEDNRMVVNQYYSQPVNRADIQKIAKELKCDYALFIIVTNDAPRVSAGLFSTTFRTTVTCDVRLLNVETANYLTSKQIVKDGSSTGIIMGIPSFDNAYNEALEKALDELTLDTTKL